MTNTGNDNDVATPSKLGRPKGGRKIDEQELIALATARKGDGSPFTHTEIAQQMGVSRPAVTKALAKLPPSLLASNDVKTYRRHRADIFADFQRLILTYITPDKLKGASINQLGTLFGIVYDKEKLERGQATQHVAVMHKSMLDEASLKKVKEVIQEITQAQITAARNESIKMSQGGME